jgi:GTP pyrophosphokinase
VAEQFRGMNLKTPEDALAPIFDFLAENLTENDGEKLERITAAIAKIPQNYKIDALGAEFLLALMLNPLLAEKPECQPEIKKNFEPAIFNLTRALRLAEQKLTGTIYHRDRLTHAVRTAASLSSAGLGHETIAAALLRHLPECSDITLELLSLDFDAEIIKLIENTNQLDRLAPTKNHRSFEQIQEVFLAVARDLRAIMIKICATIDLLKNLEEIPEEKRKNFAREALELYAPLADVFGAWRLKWQLEDYAFKYLQPAEYANIEKRFHVDEKKNRDKYIEKTKKMILDEAAKKGLACRIDGRFKHYYSIYQKMKTKQKRFNHIFDVFALRVIVDNIDDCYRMLGLIHRLWKPKSRRMKDYIAAPKSNNYRSLHTTVYGLNGRMTEFQIRTREMDEEAKYGVAAHWRYKTKSSIIPVWVKSLLNLKQTFSSEQEFIEKTQAADFLEKIFVKTPKEEFIALPRDATPVDFAYAVHSAIGNKCARAFVNEKEVPLAAVLENGDTVRIMVNPEQTLPREEWLKFVKSHQAIRLIKSALKIADEKTL